MPWQQRELKAWLQSKSLIVSKLTFGSGVMLAYSSSKKTLANLHGSQIADVVTKNFALTDRLDPGNARQ